MLACLIAEGISMKNFILGLLFLIFSQLSMAETKISSNFLLQDMAGIKHQLSQYKGKWVLVNYWATWCPPCLEEVPDLIALHGDKKNNLVVIGVAMDYRNAKQVTDFAAGLL